MSARRLRLAHPVSAHNRLLAMPRASKKNAVRANTGRGQKNTFKFPNSRKISLSQLARPFAKQFGVSAKKASMFGSALAKALRVELTKGKVFVVPKSFEVGVLVVRPQQVVAKLDSGNHISKAEVVTALVVRDKLEQDAALSKRGELERNVKKLQLLLRKEQLMSRLARRPEKRVSDTASLLSVKREPSSPCSPAQRLDGRSP